jgi:hemerythrin
MLFMPWTAELEVGIAEIDEQHRWLVDQTNALHDAMQGAAAPEVVGTLLEGLMEYVINHFIVEENLFQRLGYPDGDAHQAQHNQFNNQVMSLLHRHEQGEAVGPQTLELLKDWLIHHILKVDKAYVQHFRQHGVS